MQFWQSISYQTPEDCVALAPVAEAAGFDGISFAEHIFYPLNLQSRYPYSDDAEPIFETHELWPELWTTITAMAMQTQTLRFASAISILPLHNPFELAKTLATVARLSNNRIALGTGVGWMKEEYEAFQVDFHQRGQRCNEAIELMRLLWRGEAISYQGKQFQCDQVIMLPAPTQPVPIWVGGKSPAALKRAAWLGDGWLGTGEPIAETLAIVEQLKVLRQQAGRDQEPFDIICIQPFDTLSDDDVHQLKDAGVSALKNWTFPFVMENPNASLQEKQDYLQAQSTFIDRHR